MTSRIHTYTIKRNLRTAAVVACIILVTFLLAFFVVKTFTIQNILVEAPGMTIQVDKRKFGKNLLFLAVDTLKRDMLAEYPLLSDVRFEKKYPGTLVVRLVRRSAVVQLKSELTLYDLDSNGLVLGIADHALPLPLIDIPVGVAAIGTEVRDERVVAAVSFLRRLPPSIAVLSIRHRDSQSLTAKVGNTNIFLPQSGDLGAKADTLQIIVEGFRIKGTLPAVIDLRYEKPIITKE